jgi:HPt (histidine-containing phosphotransfer) domain-containing protein
MENNGPPEHPIFDPSRLATLEAFLNQDLTPIALSFLKECGTSVESMERAWAEGDLKQIRHHAHQMRGASSSLGMLQLAAAFTYAENESDSNHPLPYEWFAATARLVAAACEMVAKRSS